MAFPYRFGLAPGQAPPPPPPPPPGFHNAPASQQQHGIYGAAGYYHGQQQVPPAGQYGGYAYHAMNGTNPMTNTMTQHHQTASAISNTTIHPPTTHTTIPPAQTTTTTPPEAPQFSCDPCDLTFDSEKAYKAHRKSHVQCTDCAFQGSQKVVKAHYQALHGKFSGAGFKTVTVAIPGCKVQKFKICVGNRPEDIQRWIADRKKKFPRQQMSAVADKKPTKEPEKAGLSMLLAGYGSSSDDSDNDDKNAIVQEPQQKEEFSAETSLQDAAASPIPQAPAASPTPTAPDAKPIPTRSCRFFFRNGICRNGDACRFSHDIPPPQRRPNNNNNRNNNKRKRGAPTSSDTLLRKLLENDMDRESTLTLQLLKYIVKSNFFDDAASAKKKAKS